MNRTLCMETNWKGNRTQKINKRDLAKHIVGFNEACEHSRLADKACTQNSPYFHLKSHKATIALYLLKLLALGSWCDECIMIYLKTSSFSKLARILQSN